ncbi:aldo/keto reductase [Radicibacter daui]|uniref:aldo/keto reductase n=1 Tax=Radicibacter daui TaxID=3064829 RepID=UPI004046A96C
MNYRRFGKTGWQVSEIGFGAWQIGASWGDVSEADAVAALNAAIDGGLNFIDTADVYGDGRSERIIASVLKHRKEDIRVVSKAGRRLPAQAPEGYTRENLTGWIERTLKNLEIDTLDLVQLHCPHPTVYYRPEVFGYLDDLVTAGKIRHYGVSVERVEEAVKAVEYPGVASVQIIFNIFRQRPAERFFALAKEKDVAILARVPLASGLLTGKLNSASQFSADDHRNFNRHGEAFDVGETFAGVPFEVGLEAVDALRPLVPGGATMAQFALRWILMFDAVSVVIPGARNAAQAAGNVAASALAALSPDVMTRVADIYARLIKPHVHQRW